MKLFSKIATVLAGFSLALGVGVAAANAGSEFKEAKADSASLTFSSGSMSAGVITWTSAHLTIAQAQGGGSSAPSGDYIAAPRWYSGNTITFTPAANETLTGLVITANTANYATALANSFNNETANSATASSADPYTVTWAGSKTAAFSITMTAQCRLKGSSSVDITYFGAGVATYTLSYDANGADSGTVPANSATYTSGTTITVLGNTGNLKKVGYTFGGWTDGVHTYSAGDTFSLTTNTTLSAIWNVDPLSSVAVSGSMSVTNYSIAGTWNPEGLVVTATFDSGATANVTASSTFAYYNSADVAVASPADLGVGSGKTLKVTATYKDVTSAKYVASNAIEVYAGETYDFTKNWSTYSATWGGYNAYSVTGLALGATYQAAINFTYASKQTTTIDDRPVAAAKSGTTSTMLFVLDSSVSASFNITTVTISFKQWSSSKKVAAALYKGTTVSGSALDSFPQTGAPRDLTTANLNGDAFIVDFTTDQTSNQQIGISSISIGLAPKASFGTLDHISIASMPNTTIYHVGEYFDPTGLKVLAWDGANEDTATSKDVTASVVELLDDSYQFVDSDVPGFDEEVEYTESGKTVNASYHVDVYALAEYELVTAAPADWSGNYLIVASYTDEHSVSHDVAINSALVNFDQPLNFKEVTINGNQIETGQECEFVVASYNENYSMQGKNGKYAYGNSSYRFMASDTPYALTFAINGNIVTITGASGYHLRFNASTAGAERFGFYNTGDADVKLYKLVESSAASDFADEFLETLSTGAGHVCQASGDSDLDDLKVAWALLAYDFENNLSVADKEQFRLGAGSESGTNIQQAIALYDFIATKYGTRLESDDCDNYNFMGRTITPISSIHNIFGQNTNGNNVLLIVVISSITVASAIGLFFIIRRRKHN